MIGSTKVLDLDLDLTSHRTPCPTLEHPQTHGTPLRHNPPRTMESAQTCRIRRDVAGSHAGASLPACGPLVVMVRMGPWRWVQVEMQRWANG